MEKSPSIVWCNRLKKKLILSISLTLIISLIIFAFICSFCFRTYIIQQINNENFQLSTKIQRESERFFSSITNGLFSLADNLAAGENEEFYQENLLNRCLKKMSHVNRLILYDDAGKKCLTVYKKPPDSYSDWLSPIQDQDNGIFQKDVFFSRVYPSSQVFPVIDISLPIRRYANNEINGTIKAVVSIQGLWENILTIGWGKDTTVYLIDKKGKLIAHSDLGLHFAALDFSHIKRVKQFLLGARKEEIKKPDIYYSNKNSKVIGTLTCIEKTDWGIIVEEPLRSALTSYYHLQKVIYLILVGLIFLVSLVTFFLTRRFTRSIDELSRQAEKALKKNEPGKINLIPQNEINRGNRNYPLANECIKNDEQIKQSSEKKKDSPLPLDSARKLENHVIEKAGVFILVVNQEGEIILFNKKCEELIGYRKSDIIGKNWLHVMVPPENREKCLEQLKQALSQKKAFFFECPIVTRSGIYRTIFWHSTFITDEKQNTLIIHIGEDITEEKNFQQELESKNKALEEKNEELQNFVSIVSHDLKSPLYILQDFTSILLHDHKTEFGEDVMYYLERIKKNAENMEKLIIDILEFSRIGTCEDDYQVYPLIQILQRVIEELNPKIQEKNIQLHYPEKFPTVFCNPNRILQVFMNLISNSIKFMSPEREGVIEVGYFERKTEYEFYVKDNGIGIEKEYHDTVFKIFQRLRESKDIEGNGVGLAIVKKIIESHGGRIWLDSQRGEGSTFFFTLPVSRHAKLKGIPIEGNAH